MNSNSNEKYPKEGNDIRIINLRRMRQNSIKITSNTFYGTEGLKKYDDENKKIIKEMRPSLEDM